MSQEKPFPPVRFPCVLHHPLYLMSNNLINPAQEISFLKNFRNLTPMAVFSLQILEFSCFSQVVIFKYYYYY